MRNEIIDDDLSPVKITKKRFINKSIYNKVILLSFKFVSKNVKKITIDPNVLR